MKKLLFPLFFLLATLYGFSQTIVMQDGTFNTCTGTFVDSGGTAAPYGNSEDFTITLCPDTAGMAITLDFSVFATETGGDVMTIYDGPDTTGTVIGSFSGPTSPGTVYTSPSTTTGCLTIRFQSNAVVFGAGWEAAISCILPSDIPLSPFINVDTTTYTVQELVEDILIDSPCAESSNYTSSTGTDFGDVNGIGYFNAEGSGFPFAEGVILTTGSAEEAEGPNDEILGAGGWPGDADLAAILGIPLGELNNASYIQFDFVPSIPEIAFDFIFASEEYNQNFECSFSDSFAFILTNTATGVVENLAVLPGTAIPIQVTNIRPEVPGFCAAVNEIYFDTYNFLPFADETTAPIDFNGQTTVLTAMGMVTPGDPYNIKLVIADNQDDLYDAAVFIEAGSFDIDINLGDDILISDGSAPCEGETIALSSGGGSPGATYQWYIFNDATGVFDPIPGATLPTIVIDTPGLYRLEAIFASGCTVSDEVLVEFFPAPVPGIPDPLTICDDDNDGFADFTLTDADAQIIDGATGVSVRYYLNTADAEAGGTGTALASPYTNITNPQTVYARLENDITRCFNIVELELIVYDTPVLADPIPNFVVCDDDTDGFFVFDLTSWDTQVTADPTDLTINYYETLADADAATSPITPADAYTNVSNPQTIYVRLENTDGCSIVGQFDLIINPLPVYTPPVNYELCDYDDVLDDSTEFDLSTVTTAMTADDPLLNVSYYLTLADAEAGAPALPLLYTNTTNPQTIWTRIEVAATGCFVIESFDLVVLDTPFANPPVSLKECDTDTDGIDEFDLTQADADIIGGQTGVFVNYYFTLAEAEAGDPATALPSPYTNVTSPQTVYARIENAVTGCYDVTELELIVILATPLPTYELCDDDVADGFTVFDLTLWDFEIAADPTGLDITYHETAADASAGTPAITPADAYTNTSNPQTIYVRVVNSDGCVTIGLFDLEVLPLPIFTPPTPLGICDDAVLDGFAPFDLTVKDPEITGGDPTLSVTYYLTEADADAATGALVSPYTNTSNPQIIYARIDDSTTGCHDTTPMELIVYAPPTAFPPTPLERCDNDADDVALFDLTLADADIIGGQPDVFVNYYLTLAEAEVGDPATALVSPYANVSNPQIVFARIENSITGCFSTTELELIVLPATDIGTFDRIELCDDPIADGSTTFDLTIYDTVVVPDPTGLTITYHTTPGDAAVGAAPITPADAYNNVTNPQTIYVRTEDSEECVQLGQFDLFVIARPLFTVPTPYALCEDDVIDGFTEFDLTVNNLEIIDGNPFYSVQYYFSDADAEAGVDPLPPIYTNVVNPQIIYVRVDDSSTGCYGVQPLELIVVNPDAAMTPEPLTYCDPDNDGFGEFNLEDATLEITGGDPTLTVSYHETEANAESGLLPLSSPYNNIVFGTQTIYARVETPLVEDCFVIVELQLIVLDTPQIVDPEPLLACDDNDDGIVVFDLTVKDPEILDGLDPADYTVEYYEDAAFTSLIAPATAYTNLTNPQTVFVLVTDNTNLCTATTTLELIVNFPPEVFPPAPLELCDVNNPGDEVEEFDLELATPEITGGDTSLIVTYHETAADADTGDNPLTSPYTNTSNPQTIYVRVEDPDTGCFVSDVVTLDLRVNPQPSPTPDPTPIEICDADNDGFVDNFILTDRDVEIINGEPDVVVSYHETLADAQADLFPLSSPYANIVAYSQIVYARVENTLTGCFTIVELELIVLNSPELPLEIEDYVICDDDDDGIAVFDLTTKDPEIYGSQDPATLDLTYHLSEADALAGVMPIVTPAAFVNTTNPQTIWVRLFDPVTGCASVGSFELIVSLPPVIAAPGDLDALERCDDETADGFASFDLTQAEDDITLGAPGLLVQYYTTEMDAQDDTNAIDPATDYTNTVNPQTIWVRVTDGDTGCVSFTTLTIRVLPNPSPNTDPDPIAVCDEVTVGDGIEVIDLTQREAEIIGGEPGVSASYYETEADATLGDPLLAIADPTAYSNIETPQIIWVRITNDTTGCFTLVELPIIVHPLPEAPEVSDYIICEVATDGVATFDLNTKIPEILGGQDPTDLEITFHEVEADADAGINAIATPEAFVNVTNPQTIYVRITNTVTGCYSATQSFNIEVREGATATAPAAVYRICDNVGDGTDGIGEFTLSTQDAEILGGQDPVIYVVSYHASDADATTGDNALPDSYINTENPQVIWARVTNTDTGCFAITTLTLEVSPLPVISLEDSYRLCVDEFGNPIQNESGEASPPVLNTGLSDLDYTFEWFLNGNPLPETTSSIVARAGGTYTVIATETTSGLGCSAEASTTVTVSSPPTTFSAEVITNAFADDHQIQAEASGLGVYFFQLDDGPLQESGLFTNVSPGDHIVTIVDQNGCGSVSIPVGVIDYPLFFTPNQDGYHDTWNIIGIASNPTAQIYIYDRFGKLLKQLSPLGPGWDGTYNGNPMPSSDYWFQVIYEEDEVEKEFRGHFTLKR